MLIGYVYALNFITFR